MSPRKFKSVIVEADAYASAQLLVQLGLERSVCKAFSNAMKEYMADREELLEGMQAFRAKFDKFMRG
jgi:prefoldin subunit 5